MAPLLLAAPPRLNGWRPGARPRPAGPAPAAARPPELREFLRSCSSNAHDAIGDEIADGPLAGALALDAMLGGQAGPRSPGTVLTLLYRLAHGGRLALPRGGMGAVTAAMARAATAAGAVIRTGAPVERVLVENDRVVGVALASGETVAAPLVLSSVDAKTTVQLAGRGALRRRDGPPHPPCPRHGATAKLNLALCAAPRFTGLDDAAHRGRIVLAPSLR